MASLETRLLLRDLWRRLFHLKGWDRRQMIRERGVCGWLAYEAGYLRFLWQTTTGEIVLRARAQGPSPSGSARRSHDASLLRAQVRSNAGLARAVN